MSKPLVYSPLPASSYVIQGVEACEASWIMAQPLALPIWNLFWLSNPNIDNLPGAGKDWWKVYRPLKQSLSAVAGDVMSDEVLYRKLLMPVHRFAEWFERADHKVYLSYKVFGGDLWVSAVMSRAKEHGLVLGTSGNIVYANFNKKAA